MAPFLIAVIATIASLALSLLLAAKIKTPKPDATTDFENPTADAGRPIPVVFGTVTVKGTNLLWFGDKKIRTSKP